MDDVEEKNMDNGDSAEEELKPTDTMGMAEEGEANEESDEDGEGGHMETMDPTAMENNASGE